MSSQAHRATVVAALLGLAAAWNAGNVGPVVAPLSDDFAVSLAAVGVLSGTLFFGASAAGTVVAQPLGARFGIARGLRIACALMVLGNVAFALSPVFAGLAGGRVLAGLGFAVAAVLGPVYARSAGGLTAVAAFGGAFQLGVAGALGLGSALEHAGVDWRVAFAITAAIAALAFPAIPRRIGAKAPGAPAGGFLRAALRSGEVARLTALFVATLGVPLIVGAWLVHYLTDIGDLRIGVAGALSFVLFGVSAGMRLAGARAIAHGGSPAALAGAVPLLAAAGLVAVGLSTSLPVAIAAVVAMGTGFAVPYAVIVVEAQRLLPADPLAPLAFVMVWVSIVPIVVIPAVGSALDAGEGGIAFIALGAFVALAALANLRPADRPLATPPPEVRRDR